MGKGNKKKSKEETHGIFIVKPIRETNTAIIKCIGHVKEENTIADEPIACNKNDSSDIGDKYTYNITDSIYMKFFHCNIRDSFLMITKILPVMCGSIMYKTELVCGLLFNIFVEFTIGSEVKSERALIGSTLDGRYQMRLRFNDTDPPKVIDLESYHGDDFMVDTMKSLMETDEMKCMIAKLMDDRRKTRLSHMGSTNDIEIPKPRYNFTELVKQYRSTGKIVLPDDPKIE